MLNRMLYKWKLTPSLYKSSFLNRNFTSNNSKVPNVVLIPKLSPKAKIIIPISMSRYDKNRKEFDEELSALFQHTARKIHQNEIESVDVIATTALHEDWSQHKIAEIDNHFLSTHEKMLEKKIIYFLWQDWINIQGKEKHEAYYNEILALSPEGSEWYDLMVKTHNMALMREDLEVSLRYQRQEYAAIKLMKSQYTGIAYIERYDSRLLLFI